mgnify:FL=1
MAERSVLSQATQLGVEVTAGVAVSSNKKLLGTMIDLSIKSDVKVYRPSGGKFSTVTALGKEWSEAKIDGPLTYTDFVYLMAGNVAYAAPAQQGSTTAYLWTSTPSQSASDTRKTFTVEHGSSVRAHKAAYGLVNSLGYIINRNEAKIKGAMLCNRITDGITLTSTPTQIALVPVLPSQVCVYADPDSGDLGTTKLLRVFSIDWECSNRYGAVWPLDCALTGFAADVELEPKPLLKILIAADSVGMSYLDGMRTGDRTFIRVEAEGAEIDTGENYLFQHDVSAEVVSVSEFKDEQGVYAIEWTFQAMYDSGWGKAFTFGIKNALTAL